MDYVKQISTGKILEAGTNEKSTMIQNAVNAGVSEDDIEFGQTDFATMSKWLDEQDWADMGWKDKRIREYPPATDYLDGIVKGDQAQIDKYIADCLAVKDKYPK